MYFVSFFDLGNWLWLVEWDKIQVSEVLLETFCHNFFPVWHVLCGNATFFTVAVEFEGSLKGMTLDVSSISSLHIQPLLWMHSKSQMELGQEPLLTRDKNVDQRNVRAEDRMMVVNTSSVLRLPGGKYWHPPHLLAIWFCVSLFIFSVPQFPQLWNGVIIYFIESLWRLNEEKQVVNVSYYYLHKVKQIIW